MNSKIHWLIVALLLAVGCTAPPYNHRHDDALGSNAGSPQGSFLVGAHTMLAFFGPNGQTGRAVEDADLTRVDNDDRCEVAKPATRLVALFFHRSERLADGVLYQEGESGEAVLTLACDDLIPADIYVRQEWKPAGRNIGGGQYVEELKSAPLMYEISSTATGLVVAYQDGRQLRVKRFDIEDGEFKLRPTEMVANARNDKK